ncbi:MAG: hypothetical protein FWF24_07075 [Alphaproteobacteria bacterium]|nr:hypothetical protein [Alphaproteobacteria bacterium]
MRKILWAVLFAVAMMWGGAPAQAASVVIDHAQDFYVGSDCGCYGAFGQRGESTLDFDLVGTLAGRSEVRFDYSFSGVLPLVGSAIAQADQIFAFSTFGMNSTERTQLVGAQDDILIAAVWDVAANAGYITITNLSQAVIDIGLMIQATVLNLTGGPGSFTLTGKVTALDSSEVPLPAALPLFGLGMAALAAYGVRKKTGAA